MNYREFLEQKIDIAPMSGIEIDPSEVNPALRPPARQCPVGTAWGPPGYLCPVWSGKDRHAARMVPHPAEA